MKIQPGPTDRVPMTSVRSGEGQRVLDDVYALTTQIVNVYFVGLLGAGKPWVLVDAGLAGTGQQILQTARECFGPNNPPRGIVLTHGHFDHVGALPELLKQWDVPVYAHPEEMPYLTGREHYAGPYPEAGGGLIARLSRFFPDEPINISDRVHELPEDHSVPELPDWEWLHTPGHTPGHISLFRRGDNALIVGDAFVTVHQEALYDVLTQKKEITGPPRYFTSNWKQAKASVQRLCALGPTTAMTGHGLPMSGKELTTQLGHLAARFDEKTVPDYYKT